MQKITLKNNPAEYEVVVTNALTGKAFRIC